jgi:hypothetical protein
MAVHKRLTDHTPDNPTPGIVVFESCQKTVQYAFNIQTDPNDQNVPMKGGNDHHYDTVSYLVRFAEKGLAGIPDHNSTRKSLERSGVNMQDYGRDGYGG